MKVTVPSYGLHWISGGIGLLVQEDGVSDVTGIDMGLEVSFSERLRLPCPHRINLEERSSQPLVDHPLTLISLPVPNEPIGASYVADTPANRNVVQNLLRLSGAHNRSSFFPIWSKSRKEVVKLLSITNISPLVFYGYSHMHYHHLDYIHDALTNHQRQVIVLGDRWNLPGVPDEHLGLDLEGLPLEKIGANHLYEKMLKGN